MKFLKIIPVLLLFMWLAACDQAEDTPAGGGGPSDPAAPTLTAIGNITVTEGSTTPINFTVSATDPNGLTLMFEMVGSPSNLGASFDPSSRVFNWDFRNVSAGSYSVQFTVTNTAGLSDSETITIFIQSSAPVGQYANGEAKYQTYCQSCHGPGGAGGTQSLIKCIDSSAYYAALAGVMSGQASSLNTQDRADVLYYLDHPNNQTADCSGGVTI